MLKFPIFQFILFLTLSYLILFLPRTKQINAFSLIPSLWVLTVNETILNLNVEFSNLKFIKVVYKSRLYCKGDPKSSYDVTDT